MSRDSRILEQYEAIARLEAANEECRKIRQQQFDAACRCFYCGDSDVWLSMPSNRDDAGALITVCRDCALELLVGKPPPMEKITSRFVRACPGMCIRSHSRCPGVGDGNDYFGNHT